MLHVKPKAMRNGAVLIGVLGIILVGLHLLHVDDSAPSVLAVLIGLWAGTAFEHSVRWTRWSQNGVLIIYVTLMSFGISLGWSRNLSILGTMMLLTVLHMTSSIKNRQVFSPRHFEN